MSAVKADRCQAKLVTGVRITDKYVSMYQTYADALGPSNSGQLLSRRALIHS